MPDSNFVAWPSGAMVRETGEDGMAVVAYWPSGTTCGAYADLVDVITRGHPVTDVDQVFPGYMGQYADPRPAGEFRGYRSVPLTALMLLGHTSRPLWDVSAGQYWRATPNDLTEPGRRLLTQLNATYGRPAVLITHLST